MRRNQIIARLRELRDELRNNQNADVTAITNEVNTLKAELSQIEAREALFNGVELDGGDQNPPADTNPVERRGISVPPSNETPEQARERVLASPEYRSAWLNRLRGFALTEAETRAMSTAEGSAGAAVPTTTANMIQQRLEQTSALYARISKSSIPGAFKMPVESASASAAWHTENAAINGTDAGVASVSFGGFELVKLVTVSKAAQKMTIDAFERFIVSQIVRKMAIAIEAAIISGTGTDQPTGILNGVTFTAAVNKVTYEKGKTMTYDSIMDTLALLPSAYHQGAIWVCSTKTKYTQLRKIKDGEGRPMFTEGMIDGKDVIPDDQVPNGKLLLMAPDYYHMNAQQEIGIDFSEQSGFRNAQVDYRGYAILDGKPTLSEAFVLLEEAAS